MVDIKRCTTDSDFLQAMQIVQDYTAWLGIDLWFQDIDTELSNFPAMYGPPEGVFLLAWEADALAGGIGLRMLTSEICEMKRLFVYDPFKRRGVGRKLCTSLIREAGRLGYRKMRLDTLAHMHAAIRLYESLGFVEIDPYRFNPEPTAKYMQLTF